MNKENFKKKTKKTASKMMTKMTLLRRGFNGIEKFGFSSMSLTLQINSVI